MLVCGAELKPLKGEMTMSHVHVCVSQHTPVCNRWDMSFEEEEYTERRARTLTSLKENCGQRDVHKRAGSIHKPLLNFEPRDLVVDELHLLLRISDVLLCNVIYRVDCGVLSYVMLSHWSPVIIVIVFPNCVYVRVCKCTCVRVLRCEL